MVTYCRSVFVCTVHEFIWYAHLSTYVHRAYMFATEGSKFHIRPFLGHYERISVGAPVLCR